MGGSAPAVNDALTDLSIAGLPSRIARGPLVLIGVGGFLAVGAALFAIFWTSPAPLEAHISVGADGKEHLQLVCEDCVDGTTVTLNDEVATFASGKAQLALTAPLAVGNNELAVRVERPGLGRNEEIALQVPIQYRIKGDLSELDNEPPKLWIAIESVPGAKISVEGTAVELDSAGKGRFPVDVKKDLRGISRKREPLSRTLAYSVTLEGGSVEQGEVNLRMEIVPLSIDSPGSSVVIDDEHFTLAGRTAKGGTERVAGSPITVDPAGRFAQRMKVNAVGETTITVQASAPGNAPRLVDIRVKRVKDLKEESITFRHGAIESYDQLTLDIDQKKGLAVALRGRVELAREDAHATVILLDVRSGCKKPPCLARLVYGSKVKLEPGAKLSAFGHIRGSVDGTRAGEKLPEIDVEFVLAGTDL